MKYMSQISQQEELMRNSQGRPKAYLYIRVATASQLENDAPKQFKDLTEYAEQKGYAIVGKSILVGSATENLSELQRLAIDREYRGNAEVILATDPSRLSRDMNSLLGITQALALAKIHLEFADGTGDLSERLTLLSALHIDMPEIKEEHEPVDIDEGPIQSM